MMKWDLSRLTFVGEIWEKAKTMKRTETQDEAIVNEGKIGKGQFKFNTR